MKFIECEQKIMGLNAPNTAGPVCNKNPNTKFQSLIKFGKVIIRN